MQIPAIRIYNESIDCCKSSWLSPKKKIELKVVSLQVLVRVCDANRHYVKRFQISVEVQGEEWTFADIHRDVFKLGVYRTRIYQNRLWAEIRVYTYWHGVGKAQWLAVGDTLDIYGEW